MNPALKRLSLSDESNFSSSPDWASPARLQTKKSQSAPNVEHPERPQTPSNLSEGSEEEEELIEEGLGKLISFLFDQCGTESTNAYFYLIFEYHNVSFCFDQ